VAPDVRDAARRGRGSPDRQRLAANLQICTQRVVPLGARFDRKNPDIRILLSIDPSSFPTGPKPHEIWRSGDYPVVWTNRRYRMVYMNMGHNDLDYEHKTNRQLSSTFSEPAQNELITQALLWLGSA
jgi:hypothetical protein